MRSCVDGPGRIRAFAVPGEGAERAFVRVNECPELGERGGEGREGGGCEETYSFLLFCVKKKEEEGKFQKKT